jgi:hypothetical protein
MCELPWNWMDGWLILSRELRLYIQYRQSCTFPPKFVPSKSFLDHPHCKT